MLSITSHTNQRWAGEKCEILHEFVFALGNLLYPYGTIEHVLQLNDAFSVAVLEKFFLKIEFLAERILLICLSNFHLTLSKRTWDFSATVSSYCSYNYKKFLGRLGKSLCFARWKKIFSFKEKKTMTRSTNWTLEPPVPSSQSCW